MIESALIDRALIDAESSLAFHFIDLSVRRRAHRQIAKNLARISKFPLARVVIGK